MKLKLSYAILPVYRQDLTPTVPQCKKPEEGAVLSNPRLPVSDLREAVHRLRSSEVNVVSGVLKLYFRDLPEPLIPSELFHSLTRSLGKKHLNLKDS